MTIDPRDEHQLETDTEYIFSMSGAGGGLRLLVGHVDSCNNALTSSLDRMFGSVNGTDTFDASCNTCKHFVRAAMTPEEKALRNIAGMPGTCDLKQIEVRGWQRGQFCGFENAACYENRRTGQRPHEVRLFGEAV
jgi:hypothetical protein